jgi:hypothetical protein
MAVNLADRLESLSAYRHVFSPQDPNADLNPVVYSHLRIAVGGKQYHVLSRIAAAGLDYTQRTNKFAHHVVLDTSELVSAGPAWLLAQPAFMQTEWDGKPRILPVGRRPIAGTVEPDVCRHWQSAAGDAGWAGILAESANSGTKSVATVIYPPGMEVLGLVAESMSLLPPPRRWEISFSTYYTKLPPGVDCMWRFVLQGSPEAQAASRIPGATVIDLCRPLGRAVGGPLVEAARTGHLPAAQHESAGVGEEVEANKGSVPAKGQAKFKQHENMYEVSRVPPPRQSVDGYGIGPPPAPKSIGLAAHSAIAWKPKKITLTILIVVVAICVTFLFLLVDTGMLMWLRTHGIDKPVAKRADKSLVGTNVSGGDNLQAQSSSSATPTNNSAATATTPNDAKKEQTATSSNENIAGNGQASQEKKTDANSAQPEPVADGALAKDQTPETQEPKSAGNPAPNTTDRVQEPASKPDGDPSSEQTGRGIASPDSAAEGKVKVHERSVDIFPSPLNETNTFQLTQLPEKVKVVFRLFTGPRAKAPYYNDPEMKAQNTWDVFAKVGQQSEPVAIGQLLQKDSGIFFRWLPRFVGKDNVEARSFCNCILQVETETKVERIALRKPIPAKPLSLAGALSDKPMPIPLPEINDLWPDVPLSLVGLRCESKPISYNDDQLLVGAPIDDFEGLLFKIHLFDNMKNQSSAANTSQTRNKSLDYIRQCEITVDYVGVRLSPTFVFTSGWPTPEIGEPNCYKIRPADCRQWRDHIRLRKREQYERREQVEKSKDKGRSGELKTIMDEIDKLDHEEQIASTVKSELEAVTRMNIDYELCITFSDFSQNASLVVAASGKGDSSKSAEHR